MKMFKDLLGMGGAALFVFGLLRFVTFPWWVVMGRELLAEGASVLVGLLMLYVAIRLHESGYCE